MIEDAWPEVRRIGVVSDTHWPRRARQYRPALLQGLEGVDLILHAGDLTILAALEPLREIAPVVAVCGNVDEMEVRAALPAQRIVRVGRYRIGLTHGHLGTARTTPERALRSFEPGLDAVVFGHSHAPLHELRDGVLLLNPGSPTDRRHEPRFSYGLLFAENVLRGELHFFL